MNYNFTGSLTQRNINLGSAHEVSSAQLAQQARDQRAARQEVRSRHAAATRIQSVYRGRSEAQRSREVRRQAIFTQLHQVANNGQGEGGSAPLGTLSQLTRMVAFATQRKALFRRLQRATDPATSSLPPQVTRAEQHALDEDDQMLLPWAQLAAQSTMQGQQASSIIQQLALSDDAAVRFALHSLLFTIVRHLQFQGATAQARYAPYLDLFSTLLSPRGRVSVQDQAIQLVEIGLYQGLHSHIVSLTPTAKPGPAMLSSANSLALQVLSSAKVTTTAKSSVIAYAAVLHEFVRCFLSIPNLINRIPRTSLAELAVKLPVVDVADRIAHQDTVVGLDVSSAATISILANFVALGWKRVPHMPDGASVKAYLAALTRLQDSIADGTLRTASRHAGTPTALILADEEERHVVDRRSAPSAVDASTLNRLQILASQEHISALLSASARFPNSTREALCAYLASALQSWDAATQDKILACIAYRYSGPSTTGPAARSATHSIGGLVRELWRGWIRGSRLARSLSNEALQGRRPLLNALSDETLSTAWPCLVILCHLYSRSLLTIGDDEFYPEDSRQIASSSNAAASAMRNPLTLDEVVTLSGLLRNLVFAMYWYEGTGGALNDLSHNYVTGMPKMDLLSLRNVVTRLLQQLHQRDSRRKFAPDDHWLMNSEVDLNSFIQSVVMEEDELNRKREEDEELGGEAMDVDGGLDASLADADEDGGASTGRRPAISARLANHRAQGGQSRALTARNLAYLSPRLGVLNNIPFVIPFEVRVEIFHQFTELDYARLRRQKSYVGPLREITIRRTNVAEDGFLQLNGLGENLKHRMAIKFVDQFGIEESGIDGGGLFKEFLTSLIKEAFDTDRGLWSATSDQQLYPNPHRYAQQEDNLQWYRFLGRVLGKALYHGILVDINFASFFLSKWLGRGHSYLDDLSGLESLDKEVYRNLLWLKHYNGDVEKDLALDFTVIDEEFGEKRVHELVPNGKSIPVTRENRLEYIYRVSHYRLNEQIRLQSEAFLAGLTDLIDLRWLRMLNREELRILISGTEGEIDLDDLRTNTVLGGYHEKDQVVDFFWASLASFTHEQRKAFLKFATSCPSPPLLGFGQLNPKFGIRHAGDDVSRLPTASTCVNLLKLPRYTSLQQCREKLLYAIESGAGFDLS